MAQVGVNKLLPFAVVTIFIVLAVVVFKSATKKTEIVVHDGELEIAPELEAVDVDSPSDTIRSLQGQVELLQKSVDSTTQENEKLASANSELMEDRNKISQEIEKTLENKLSQSALQANVVNTGLAEKYDDIASSITSLKSEIEGRVSDLETAEIPVGLGLGSGDYPSGSVISATEVTDVVWIQPLDSSATDIANPVTGGEDGSENIILASTAGSSKRTNSSPTNNIFTPTRSEQRNGDGNESPAVNSKPNSISNRLGSRLSGRRNETTTIPNPKADAYYTLPDLSILANSTMLTALIGRVYIDDNVTNPYPFKVLIGRENLTANKHDLPVEIESMIFEGFATGDWPLNCVRGTLTAATFVFNDGSIKSAYVGDPGTRPNEGPFDPNALGYISDPYGNPCIAGKPITNAPRFLAQRFLLAGAEGYARALRAQNIDDTQTVDQQGNVSVTQALTGSATEVGVASAYIGGIEETTDWLRERQRQSFDAIYIQSGQNVVINLQQELRLDIEPNARLINYGKRGAARAKLD